jgi:hypothetical protein
LYSLAAKTPPAVASPLLPYSRCAAMSKPLPQIGSPVLQYSVVREASAGASLAIVSPPVRRSGLPQVRIAASFGWSLTGIAVPDPSSVLMPSAMSTTLAPWE